MTEQDVNNFQALQLVSLECGLPFTIHQLVLTILHYGAILHENDMLCDSACPTARVLVECIELDKMLSKNASLN
jgi:hypothetical protein